MKEPPRSRLPLARLAHPKASDASATEWNSSPRGTLLQGRSLPALRPSFGGSRRSRARDARRAPTLGAKRR